MSRKRMVDPKFWTDDKIIELKRETRLLFIGMWNFSNDYGLHINNNKVLKAEIYPIDEDINIEPLQADYCELGRSKWCPLYVKIVE